MSSEILQERDAPNVYKELNVRVMIGTKQLIWQNHAGKWEHLSFTGMYTNQEALSKALVQGATGLQPRRVEIEFEYLRPESGMVCWLKATNIVGLEPWQTASAIDIVRLPSGSPYVDYNLVDQNGIGVHGEDRLWSLQREKDRIGMEFLLGFFDCLVDDPKWKQSMDDGSFVSQKSELLPQLDPKFAGWDHNSWVRAYRNQDVAAFELYDHAIEVWNWRWTGISKDVVLVQTHDGVDLHPVDFNRPCSDLIENLGIGTLYYDEAPLDRLLSLGKMDIRVGDLLVFVPEGSGVTSPNPY